MMSATLNHDSEGLEVVPGSDHNAEGLEVAHNHGFGGLEPSTKDQPGYGVEAVSKDGSSNMDNIENARWSQKPNPRRKRLWLIVAAVVLVLVIVGAVVGGVVGSQSSSHKASATPSSSSSPSPSTSTPSSSATPSSIDSKSAIGVTGWWNSESDFSIRLAYQGDDTYMHVMQYNSGDDDWSTMTILTELDMAPDSPIALSCFNNSISSNSAPTSDNVSNTFEALRGTYVVANEWQCRTLPRSRFFTSVREVTSRSGGYESNKCPSNEP
jgi:hypothetical protein